MRLLLRRLVPRAEALPLAGDAARVGADGAPGAIDVIVPVYGAAEALGRCLRSLAAHTDLTRHRLVLVLDGPQPGAVAERVAEICGELTPGGAGATAATTATAAAGVVVLRQAERAGFVAAVNLGMAASGNDVVLLNSDTQVTAGWLEKLQRAAWSAPEIATVTPFSNSATICSLPRFLESNALPAGWDLERFARLVEERSQRVYPRLPTGVGVCLYIKRKALAALGPFDSASFGLGYGEESEFCMRALKAGYAHVLDDATFIFHEGHRSFGTSRRRRVAAAHRSLARLHPEYVRTVARFLHDDALRPLRERVIAALLPPGRTRDGGEADGAGRGDGSGTGITRGSSGGLGTSGTGGGGRRAGGPQRVLHIVHGWPPWNHAGTELYAAWLVRRQAAHRDVTVLSRIADPARGLGDAVELLDAGARVRLLVRNFDERDPRSRNALSSRPVELELMRLLDETRPQLVHVHHLGGLAASLPRLVRRRGIPILYQVQDWWTPCARANLLDAHRRLCSGPAPAKCSACLPLTGLPPAPLLNRLLYRYRNAATAGALRGAAAYVTGSRFLRDSYVQLGLLRPQDPIHVIPYGVELTPAARRPARPPGAPLRFGCIGSILPHKGIHVAVAAFAGIDPQRAQLVVWGDPTISPAYTRELIDLGAVEACPQAGSEASGSPQTEGAMPPPTMAPVPMPVPALLAGRFEDARKADIFAAMDVLIIPSLGLESFGLVAREAMHHGVPVLASQRGALVELFDGAAPGEPEPASYSTAAGALFTAGDAADLRRWIDRLLADPGLLPRWVRALPPIKSADQHADEIEDLYQRILEAVHVAR